MFRVLIKRAITSLRSLVDKLEKTYDETYLFQDLKDAINKFREENKKEFIENITHIEFMHSKFNGVKKSTKDCKRTALKMFEKAKENGDLDLLYKLKGEEYDD